MDDCYLINNKNMFYKKDNNGNWFKGSKVHLPNGVILTEENKQSIDGWEWYDTAPQEYIDYLEEQDEI